MRNRLWQSLPDHKLAALRRKLSDSSSSESNSSQSSSSQSSSSEAAPAKAAPVTVNSQIVKTCVSYMVFGNDPTENVLCCIEQNEYLPLDGISAGNITVITGCIVVL